jgi:hypothetical protein
MVRDDSAADAQLLADLHLSDSTVFLVAQEGDFYDFGIQANTGGGLDIIARKMDGHFTIIWQGQDVPPCPIVNNAEVPSGIAPYCFNPTIIDRSNEIRAWVSRILNPFIDSQGNVSF